MKAVILAGGYGTRFQRDVASDASGRFSQLVGCPKPLVPVGGSALISHWVRALSRSGCVDRVCLVTNDLYRAAFEDWAAEFSNVDIVSDQTTSNEERLGAVACLHLAVKHLEIDDDVTVIGGDTLFREDFSLTQVIQRFSVLQSQSEDSCLLLSYPCQDEETQKYGILEVDKDLRVLRMKEKPLASETDSRRACPCFYVFSKKSLLLLDAFLEEKKGAPIEEKDAPGHYVSWLIPRTPVYIHEVCGRFDVGNLSSYITCDLYFKEQLKHLDSYMV